MIKFINIKNMSIIQKPTFKERYGNYIGGKFVPPVQGKYFDNISPIDGQPFTKVPHSTKEDISQAVEAAAKAFESWKKPPQQSEALSCIASPIGWRSISKQ